MILVDSSVWIDHFRRKDTTLTALLDADRVMTHPYIIGELALGHLHARAHILPLLTSLPQAIVVEDWQVLAWIERHALHGQGIGYIDAHLLASASVSEAKLWTRDKHLNACAKALGIT